jgi:hypothetical protein
MNSSFNSGGNDRRVTISTSRDANELRVGRHDRGDLRRLIEAPAGGRYDGVPHLVDQSRGRHERSVGVDKAIGVLDTVASVATAPAVSRGNRRG